MSDKAQALWTRMAEMFGAEALSRKYGDRPSHTWTACIDGLPDHELQRGMNRLLHSGKGYVPSLPEFLRMCREIGGDYAHNEAPAPRTALPSSKAGMDGFDTMANDHFLAHILRLVIARLPTPDKRELRAYLDAKAVWADEMRDRWNSKDLLEDGGKSLWAECMANAAKAAPYQ